MFQLKMCENRVEIVYSYVRLLLTKNFQKPSEKGKREENPHRIIYLINYCADVIKSSCEWGI